MGEPSLDQSLKAREVEERTDLLFYRPLGFVIARALGRTRIHPNQVTWASIVLGVASGHLLYYRHIGLDAAAALAFVVANLLDSVDGQLARLKRLQTQHGRVLDGLAGASMFTSIYLHLGLRGYADGGGLFIVGLALLALYSQAVQNSIADCLLNAYLTYGVRQSGYELDDAGEIRRRAMEASGIAQRVGMGLYAGYMATQERLTPALQRFRALVTDLSPQRWAPLSSAYRRLTLPVVRQRAWIATNIRMMLLFVAVFADRIVWYFWFNIVALNLAMIVLLLLHERHCRELSRLVAGERPSPPV